MTRHTSNHKPKGITKTEAAKLLGVTREHLSRVLHGHRASRSLSRRYAALVTQKSVDWERCVKLYDSPETLFFIDPPYLNADPTAYEGWNEEQMERLAEVLAGIKGKWILTVDGSEFCQRLFARWKCRLLQTHNQATNLRLSGGRYFSELFVTSEAAE